MNDRSNTATRHQRATSRPQGSPAALVQILIAALAVTTLAACSDPPLAAGNDEAVPATGAAAPPQTPAAAQNGGHADTTTGKKLLRLDFKSAMVPDATAPAACPVTGTTDEHLLPDVFTLKKKDDEPVSVGGQLLMDQKKQQEIDNLGDIGNSVEGAELSIEIKTR